MIGSRLDTVGTGLIAIGLISGFAPFMILGRTADPSTQAYQDAKGSWIPKAMMNDKAMPFWMVAGGLLAIGLLTIAVDRFLDRRGSGEMRSRKKDIDSRRADKEQRL